MREIRKFNDSSGDGWHVSAIIFLPLHKLNINDNIKCMKRRFLLYFAITLASMNVWAQVQYADPYLTAETRPDAVAWLPEPPLPMSGEFYNDFYFYEWGKSQRETRGEQALWDESAGLYEVFSESIGIKLSPEH